MSAGRPTRFQQIELLLDKIEGYIDRAAKIAHLEDDAYTRAVLTNLEATKGAVASFQARFEHNVTNKHYHLKEREDWEARHTYCANCLATDQEIPLSTCYVLSNYRKAHADRHWNWLRLCVYCASKQSLKRLGHRLWLKQECDPLEYDWQAACTWYRQNCVRDADVNWITRPVPPSPKMRQKSPELKIRLDGN